MPSSTIAILGGTGALGSGLAGRLARAGHHIILGSRDAARATEKAESLSEHGGTIEGSDYRTAAEKCDIAILTVPFASHAEILGQVAGALSGKILVDASVPLVPPKVATVQLPPQGSAAVAAQALLGEEVTVVSAFQNVGALHLQHSDEAIDCDVLVTGNTEAARAQVIALVEDCGLRGWHAGPLANSTAAEALTSVMIFINRFYKTDRAGIRVTGA